MDTLTEVPRCVQFVYKKFRIRRILKVDMTISDLFCLTTEIRVFWTLSATSESAAAPARSNFPIILIFAPPKMGTGLIVQGIERKFPKLQIQVRVLVRLRE